MKVFSLVCLLIVYVSLVSAGFGYNNGNGPILGPTTSGGGITNNTNSSEYWGDHLWTTHWSGEDFLTAGNIIATNLSLGSGEDPTNLLSIELEEDVSNFGQGFSLSKGIGSFSLTNGVSTANRFLPSFTGVGDGLRIGLAFDGTEGGNINAQDGAVLFRVRRQGGSGGIDDDHVAYSFQNYVTQLVNVFGNGNVRIGSTANTLPSEKLLVEGNVSIEDDLNVEGDIDAGSSFMGSWTDAVTYAVFGHKDFKANGDDYGLMQSPAGKTFLNSKAGQVLSFRIGNSEKMQLDTSGNLQMGGTNVYLNQDNKYYYAGASDDTAFGFDGTIARFRSDMVTPTDFYIETGAGKSVVIPDGDLNVEGNWTGNDYYGSVFGNEIGETIINTQGVYENVTNLTQGLSNGFTFNDSGNEELSPVVGGVYEISSGWSFSGSANTEYHLRIAVNGSAADNCHAQRKIGTGGDVGSASTVPCMIRLYAGDRVNMQIENVDSTTNPFLHDVGMTIKRVGN